jgi:hypothetical protein
VRVGVILTALRLSARPATAPCIATIHHLWSAQIVQAAAIVKRAVFRDSSPHLGAAIDCQKVCVNYLWELGRWPWLAKRQRCSLMLVVDKQVVVDDLAATFNRRRSASPETNRNKQLDQIDAPSHPLTADCSRLCGSKAHLWVIDNLSTRVVLSTYTRHEHGICMTTLHERSDSSRGL